MRNLKIFTNNIEKEAINQIDLLLKQEAFENCKVRIMPDVHAGNGCVIGFTADLGDKVIPNIVGVDIGCGMLTIPLGNIEINLCEFDQKIKEKIPYGMNVHTNIREKFSPLKDLKCLKILKDIDRIERSLGSLGGGNHFIEIDVDDDGYKYLIIHSGSRNLGKQVAEFYQKLAIDNLHKNAYKIKALPIIEKLKRENRHQEISSILISLADEVKCNIPQDLCYLEGIDRLDYLHDMKICQDYAVKNRELMAKLLIGELSEESFHTIHNYMDFDTNIVRKGAIRANFGELLLIPMNMRDGCIMGLGKGNEDWNYSAPHGAGRIMSRGKAKAILDFSEYKKSMEGIYTTSVVLETIDEAPFVYKPTEEIIKNIQDTVEIIKVIKPIYNFKAYE